MIYSVKEAFVTIQGEGTWTGSKAVFVRLSGCNIWTGREEHRERDSAKGVCAMWCDTDFVGTNGLNGGKYTEFDLLELCNELWEETSNKIVVFTGGEPSLQLTEDLVQVCVDSGWRVHVETNGARVLPINVTWACLSPKPPFVPAKQRYHEIKVPYDGTNKTANPLNYYDATKSISYFIQPLDLGDTTDSMRACVNFVMDNPAWRVTLQAHKILGMP